MSRRLGLIVAAMTVGVVGVVAALGWALYSSLTPGRQAVLRDGLGEQVALLVGSALLLAALVAAAVGALVSSYASSARRLAAATEVIASVNPDQPVPHGGAPELRAVAAAVERLAERYRAQRCDVAETVRRASAEVEEERNRLAALMAELAQPVIVCNADGRILLYNTAAGALEAASDDGGFIGLGRSLFRVLDRDLVVHALGYISDLEARGEERTAAFATEIAGRLVRAHISPVGDPGGEGGGFVLVLDDVTREAALTDRRGAALQDLVEGTQRAVASIRAAVETLQDFGEVDPEQRDRLMRIVRDESAALSARVDGALHDAAALVAEGWGLEEMRGRDLLALVRRGVERLPGVAVQVGPDAADAWLRVDAYALARAVVALAEHLRSEHGVADVSLELARADAHAALDLRWTGAPLDAETLRAWDDEPVMADGRRLPFTLRDVLDRHGAEVWSQRDSDSAVLRLLLPTAPAPASVRRAARDRPSAAARPGFYDFDLFARMEPETALEAQPLADLSYTVFDCEMTGLDPGRDELIAIGAVRVVNGRILAQETFEQLIDPGRPVSPEAMRIHGISRAMLDGQPSIDAVLPRFARFAEDTVLVGHNVAFDMRFLAEKEEQTGVRFTQPVLDTLLLSPAADPHDDDHSLEAIAQRLGVSVIGRHTALGDALVTAELFLGLVRLLEPREIVTLGQALDASRQTYQARVSEALYARS